MESPEFNLSVLENVTTFSTPLKNCSDYEAILSLIKEEIDISQTEDEGDYHHSRPNNASRPRARRPALESHDYNGKFKSPYEIHHAAKTKSPGTALFSRTKRKSQDDSKNDTRKHGTRRARSLGRVMPGRSLKSTCKQQRSSDFRSDTSGFSDPIENGKTLNRKSLTPRKKIDYDGTDAYETEGEALEELLTTAQEHVIVNGSPYGRNSTISSQGGSTSLATSDPLDTGAMEEECYVESSQPIGVSDLHTKFLNHRGICDMPKNVEMIKRNLHFSDAPESEEDNQNFSLALSPEPPSLLNYEIDGNSASAADRKKKESQDSVASIFDSLTSSSRNFYSQREASTSPPRPRTGKSSQDSIVRAFNSLSANSENQREASTTSQLSRVSKRRRESTPSVQNSTYDLHDLERKRQTSTTPQPCMRNTSRESTPSTASTLNFIHDLEELEPKRELSTTPDPCTRKTRQGSTPKTPSTPSTLNLPQDLEGLELKTEASTPQHSNTSEEIQDSNANILNNLTQDLQDLDPERDASTTLEPSSMRKASQGSTFSTPENLAEGLPNFNSEKEASATLPHPKKRKTSRESPDTLLTNLTQEFDLNNVNSAKEASVTPLRCRERKKSKDSTSSCQTNLTREMQNLVPETEVDAPPLYAAKLTKTSEDRIDHPSKGVTPNSCNSHNQREASPTAQPSSMRKTSQHNTTNIQESVTQDPQNLNVERHTIAVPSRSRHRKTSEGSISNSQESLTQELENLHFKREASATPLYHRHPSTSLNSMASSQNSFTSELNHFDSAQEARQVTPVRPKKRKTSQASTASSAKSPTRNPNNVDFAKEVSVAPLHPQRRKTTEDNIANSQESLTENQQDLDFKREASATPPYPRHRTTSQNSIGSSQSFTEELRSVDSAHNAGITHPRLKKRKMSQASTVNFARSPTRDPSNVDSTKEASVSPPCPKKKRKKKSDIAMSLEVLTQDTSTVDPANEASLPPPRSTKRKKNKTKIASPPKNVTQDLNDLVPKSEPSMTPPRLRKSKSSVVSPLKGLTQELENCMTNVDFERLCEEIDNDMESPSFTFETVQLLDDYDDCNPEANNKILSKILASPNSKTDEETPKSVEHIGSSEDLADYDPLYIASAEDNETAKLSTSKRNEKTGTKKAGNERKSLMVDKTVKECKKIIDNVGTLEEGPRRSSRTKKTRVTMTVSDWEKELDQSDKAAQVPKKVQSSSEDSLDYDALYTAEAEDNEPATPSTSKKKENTVTKKKRKSLVDKSFKTRVDTRSVDNDGTLEEGTRRSSRTRKHRATMTVSDLEEESDLSREAAEVAEKVEAAKQKERLSPGTFKKVNGIVVHLRHKVLPQHDIEPRAGTVALTYKQQMQFLDYATLNKDIYSTTEDEIIKTNWNAFCADHNWDPQNYKVFLNFKHGDGLIMSSMEERRKFVQFLADGLPNRPLFSVYNRFKKIYSEYPDAGEWYKWDEDKKILAYMLRYPEKKPETKFAELSKVLRRPRHSIWKRYQILQQKKSCHERSKKVVIKVEWNLSLVTEFITKLLDVTISDDLMELKDAFIPIVVWRKLEEKTGFDHNFMQRSWEQQFHLQFFSPEPLFANAMKIRLIEYMWMKGIRDGSEIQWHVVAKYFDGCTIKFLRKMFNHLTADASIALKSRNLSDIMKWLHEIKIRRLRSCLHDQYLPRLRYVDKTVEIVPEDMTKATLISKRPSLN